VEQEPEVEEEEDMHCSLKTADQALHIVQTRQTRMRVIVYLYLAKEVLILIEKCLVLGIDSNIYV